MSNKYYSLDPILDMHAVYNMIFGERSNGKTFAVEERALRKFCNGEGALALLRRRDLEIRGANAQEAFTALVCDGDGRNRVREYTNDKFDSIINKGARWYLAKYDAEKDKCTLDNKPFAYGFALNTAKHSKGTSYPQISTILLDEFIDDDGEYLVNEYNKFQQVVSTIVRQRTDVEIFLCGNSISPWNCPYFQKMGIINVRKMEQGTIDYYTYKKDERLSVAVEYCLPNKRGKPNDYLFAFDSPDLDMITDGGWQTNAYPLAPMEWEPADIVFRYFIILENYTFEADIVKRDGCLFTFIHPKTTPIKDEDRDLVYCQEYDPRPNWRRKITKGTRPLERKLYEFFRAEKVYYADNETGEAIRAYLMWCNTEK